MNRAQIIFQSATLLRGLHYYQKVLDKKLERARRTEHSTDLAALAMEAADIKTTARWVLERAILAEAELVSDPFFKACIVSWGWKPGGAVV